MNRVVYTLLVASGIAGFSAVVSVGTATDPFRKSAEADGGMVAAAHPLAVEAGLEILAKGGNAVDAAVATAFALTVVEPFGSSIGGDGVALVYVQADDSVTGYDYRCEAPRAANYDVFDYSALNDWHYTPLGSAVPGMVKGTVQLHEDFGLLPLDVVMAPAIRHAEQGFGVGRTLSGIITDMYSRLADNPETAAIYLVEEFPPEVGSTLRNPDLARSLELIAAEGSDAMYNGALGQRIASYLQANGGVITEDDFRAYEVVKAEALSINYRGYRIYSPAPPFGGLAVLQSLKLYEQSTPDTTAGALTTANVHLMTEIMRLTSADRYAVSGDPRFVQVPTSWLLSDEYARERVKLFDPTRALPRELVQPGPLNDPGDVWGSTTHLTVVDGQGNAVSITQTLGGFFGTGVLVPGTGIVLNDQMKNFSRLRTSPNNLQPGKRMNSTQSPTIVTRDGELILAVGSPGNYRILTTVFLMIVYILDYQLPMLDAVEAPRFSARNTLRDLSMEQRFPDETYEGLRALGHNVRVRGDFDLFFGGVHAILRDPETGLLTGAADPRRDGVADGITAAAAD